MHTKGFPAHNHNHNQMHIYIAPSCGGFRGEFIVKNTTDILWSYMSLSKKKLHKNSLVSQHSE